MRVGLLLLLLAALTGCRDEATAPASGGPVVARVGEVELTEAELRETLGSATPGLDSASARRQIIAQWVRRELIVQEARRAGLDDDPVVKRSLRDSERAVLEAAYISRFFETSLDGEPTEPEIEAYYEANRERLTLQEPYVRLRLLHVASGEKAVEAQNALAQIAGSPISDSLFALAAREYGRDPDGAIALSETFLPESRLVALDETLGARITTLGAGAPPAIIPTPEAAGAYVVTVVDRIQAGQTPGLAAVRPEIVETLAIRKRKAAEARHINRLRSEAEAAGALTIK